MNSNSRIAATLFPKDIVCLRNISINVLHKGGDDDDDDDDNNNNNSNNRLILERTKFLMCWYLLTPVALLQKSTLWCSSRRRVVGTPRSLQRNWIREIAEYIFRGKETEPLDLQYNSLSRLLFNNTEKTSMGVQRPNRESDMQISKSNFLTTWCRVLLEQLTGLQLVKKYPAFHGTRRFITALTSVRHLPLSTASPIQSIYPHPTFWRSVLILSTHWFVGLGRLFTSLAKF